MADGNRECGDLDLLTFEEAGIRLRDEIGILRQQLHDASPLSAAERGRLEERLRLLVQTRDRLDPATARTSSFEKYFGRPAATHRTVAWEELAASLTKKE